MNPTRGDSVTHAFLQTCVCAEGEVTESEAAPDRQFGTLAQGYFSSALLPLSLVPYRLGYHRPVRHL